MRTSWGTGCITKLGFLASRTGEDQSWEKHGADWGFGPFRFRFEAEDIMRLCCCSAWRSCSKELANLYAPALSRLDWSGLGWGVGLRPSIIISSSSSSSPDATEDPPQPREDPSKDGANILRRFTSWLDEGSDEIGSDSGRVAWATGNGDEGRCRLSISKVLRNYNNASDAQSISAECENSGRRTEERRE